MKPKKIMILLAAVASVALCFTTGCTTSSGSSGGESYSESSSSYSGFNIGTDPDRIAAFELSEAVANAKTEAEAKAAIAAYNAKRALPPPE